jgi:hypothetical protein
MFLPARSLRSPVGVATTSGQRTVNSAVTSANKKRQHFACSLLLIDTEHAKEPAAGS